MRAWRVFSTEERKRRGAWRGVEWKRPSLGPDHSRAEKQRAEVMSDERKGWIDEETKGPGRTKKVAARTVWML